MIRKKEIVDAVNLLLAGLYPDRTVYRDAIPEQAERPAFAIAMGERKAEIGGCEGTADITQPFTVQCLDKTDEHYEADTDRLSEVSDAVELLFLCGYVRVGDRCLTVEAVDTVRDLDVANVNVTLHYLDDRPPAAEVFPPAAEVVANITAKEAH